MVLHRPTQCTKLRNLQPGTVSKILQGNIGGFLRHLFESHQIKTKVILLTFCLPPLPRHQHAKAFQLNLPLTFLILDPYISLLDLCAALCNARKIMAGGRDLQGVVTKFYEIITAPHTPYSSLEPSAPMQEVGCLGKRYEMMCGCQSVRRGHS